MKSNYDELGKHIQLVDRRNSDMVSDNVLGINIDKFFMPWRIMLFSILQ